MLILQTYQERVSARVFSPYANCRGGEKQHNHLAVTTVTCWRELRTQPLSPTCAAAFGMTAGGCSWGGRWKVTTSEQQEKASQRAELSEAFTGRCLPAHGFPLPFRATVVREEFFPLLTKKKSGVVTDRNVMEQMRCVAGKSSKLQGESGGMCEKL